MKDFKLDTQPKIKPVFEASDTYLDQLQKQVVSSIQQEKNKKAAFRISTRGIWRYAAAAVVVIAASIPIVNKSLVTTEPTSSEIEHELLRNVDFGSVAFALDSELSLVTTESESTDPVENELLENTNVEFLITEPWKNYSSYYSFAQARFLLLKKVEKADG